jgi:hypothetical protein
MINNKKSTLLVSAFLTALTWSTANAKVSGAEVAKLDNELTPMGSVRAGNADGSIPAWTGGIKAPPAGYKKGDFHIDPFAADKIKVTINSGNYQQHASKLTPGQIKMFETYPTFSMNVYPTRRSASYPQYVYDAYKANAASATILDSGTGLKNATITSPFPIPQSGLEAIWNHNVRFRGVNVGRFSGQAAVTRDGDFNIVMFRDELMQPYMQEGITSEELEKTNLMFLFKQWVISPARLAGTALLVHEPIDQVRKPRQAWTYNTGQRRVRRAPNVAYDAPGTAADGLRTTDDFDMFNGAPDRYNWEIIGKKEIYIPYNSYMLNSDKLKYDDILMAGHINPEYVRYELHRVWEVKATLKSGTRHVYKSRTFYLDEDTWQAAIVENYDNNDQLWRVAMSHAMNYYELPLPWSTLETYYDLQSGRYLAMGLDNEHEMYEFDITRTSRDFSPAALRRSGRR